MNTVSTSLDTDVRIATGRAHAEEPNDSSRATFQDAVDARREERARSASRKDDAGTEESGEAREEATEPVSEDSGARDAEAAEEAPDEAKDDPQPDRREKRSDARESRDGSAPVDGGLVRRESPRDVKGANAKSADTVQGLPLDLRFPVILPSALHSSPTAVATAVHDEPLVDSAVEGPATPAPASDPRAGSQGAASPAGTATPGFDAAPSATSSPAVDALATLHAARAAGSAVLTTDPRVASGARGATPAGESAAAREAFAPRMSPAELPAFLESLAVRVDGPQRNAVVELDPVELGRVSISLSLDRDGGVRADVRAQRPEGFAALEARLPDLRASLIERGFESASVNLSLGLPDSRSQRSGTEDGRGSSSPHRGRTLAAAEIQAMLPTPPARPGAVDLWA